MLCVKRLAAVDKLYNLIFNFKIFINHSAELIGIYQIADADSAALGLVNIAGTDTLFCCSYIACAPCLFGECVKRDMIRHNNVRPCVYLKIFCADSLTFHTVYLTQKNLGVNNNAHADYIERSRV